jgi:bacterioferritin
MRADQYVLTQCSLDHAERHTMDMTASLRIQDDGMYEQDPIPKNSFLNELRTLRESARILLEGANKQDTKYGDETTSVALLQSVLAAEVMCICRYTMISLSHGGLKDSAIGIEFQEQANDERKHMAMIAGRIEEIGGIAKFDTTRALAATFSTGNLEKDFTSLLKENLLAEQYVIGHYHELIGYFAQRDIQTSKMLSEIIQDEEEHSRDMKDFLNIGA